MPDNDCDGRLKYPEFKRLVEYKREKLPGEQWQALCTSMGAGASNTIIQARSPLLHCGHAPVHRHYQTSHKLVRATRLRCMRECSCCHVHTACYAHADPMKGLDLEAFIRFYVESNKDPMKEYEEIKEAIELEEQTKAAIAAQMEQMAQAKGGGGDKESRKEAKKRRKEEAKRNKQEAKLLRKSRKSG